MPWPADQSEKLAIDGLNRLEIKILDFVYKKEEEKAIKCIKSIDSACKYLNKHTNVIKYATVFLREIGHISIIEGAYEAAIKAIEVLKSLINYNKEIAKDAAQEILNIIAQALGSKKLEKGNIEVAKEGIGALIEIGYLPSDDLTFPSKELQEKVNNLLLLIIDDLNRKSDGDLDINSKIIIAKKILEYADIKYKYQARDLVILGAQIYQADKQNDLNEIIKEKLKKAKLDLSDVFKQAKDYANGLKINVDIDSFKTFVLTQVS